MKIQYFLKRLKHKCLTHQFNPIKPNSCGLGCVDSYTYDGLYKVGVNLSIQQGQVRLKKPSTHFN